MLLRYMLAIHLWLAEIYVWYQGVVSRELASVIKVYVMFQGVLSRVYKILYHHFQEIDKRNHRMQHSKREANTYGGDNSYQRYQCFYYHIISNVIIVTLKIVGFTILEPKAAFTPQANWRSGVKRGEAKRQRRD